jgi:lipoprotein-anchoring transpeptidase ErfK/SrfK
MRVMAVACLMLAAGAGTASAQSWAPWNHPDFGGTHSAVQRDGAPTPSPFETQSPTPTPAVLQGGPRPDIAPQRPATVSIRTGHGPGTVVIDTRARRLYLMQSPTTALAYPISVGREGFRWTGTERISRVASWPDWRPPAEMRRRQAGLPELMTGGIRNPLGAKALYLGATLYRIHGTNDAQSIGQANSSGCFRMSNAHVVDLANRVGVGTTVVVKSRL